MTQLVDIVNFNADASCLRAGRWLDALRGGAHSEMCRWLLAYVEHRRRVVFGFTGATIADLAGMNPEAIALVNRYSDVFEVILRPFAHDVALLRSPSGFALNVEAGRRTIEQEFARITPYFLPAEFMLTNGQVSHLARVGVRGTFVNASRLKQEIRARIPGAPYLVRGLFGSTLRCVPIQGSVGECYLEALHLWDAEPWNQILSASRDTVFSWRDGESFLFVPDGIEREKTWLACESRGVQRMFLSEADSVLDCREPEDAAAYGSYPVHSFSDWIKEFRMLGYLRRLEAQESRLNELDADGKALWFQAIGSDVLSAVEKDSPAVTLRTAAGSSTHDIRWTIERSERGFEGEEFLEMLENHTAHKAPQPTWDDRSAPHLHKLRARREFIRKLPL